MAGLYKLDNAAKIFPAVTSPKNTSVYRVSVVLLAPVDKFTLQKAADKAIPRYPMLFMKLRRGIFWNYFESNNLSFTIEEELTPPCSMIIPHKNSGYFLKLLYSGNRISLEIFHSLTDGFGGIELLKTILYYYFSIQGNTINSEGKVLLANGYIPPDNLEDSFAAYYNNVKYKPLPQPDAYHITGTAFENLGACVTTGILNANAINKVAKTNGATVTTYLTSALIYSIYATRQNYDGKMPPIVISVPVSLRREFPSTTLRNFFGIVNVCVYVNKNTSFEDIVAEVAAQMKEKTTRENLQNIISSNVLIEKRLYTKLVPLWIKKHIVNAMFNFIGEKKKTISLSNLGKLSLPGDMCKLISHFEAMIYTTEKAPITVCMCSSNEKLSISFTSAIQETDVLRYFFRHLAKQNGLVVAVYSNEWGLQNETL